MVDSRDTPTSLLGFGRRRENCTEKVEKPTSGRGVLSILARSTAAASDTSSSSDGEELTSPDEFVVECENGEMVFVTAAQGKAIKSRCRYFHEELLSSSNQLVRNPSWPLGTLRHLIELLSTGSTWIPNDEICFTQLLRAADEVGIDARLTSLINQHDVLNKTSTDRFFPMIDPDYLQFKIRATVKSCQWVALMKQGILMLLQPKVLVIKLAPNRDSSQAESSQGPSLQRLAACDGLCSEFSVYAKGNVKTLLTILTVLAPSTIKAMGQPEKYKVVFKTKCGMEAPEDLEMLLRISTASYKKSNRVEEEYLNATPSSSNTPEKTKSDELPSQSTALVVAIEAKQEHSDGLNGDSSTDETVATVTRNPEKVSARNLSQRYEYRTLSGESFVVLKHLFDAVNTTVDKECDEIPVCLMLANPAPDTLARFLNAACSCESCSVGFDLDDNCFYVSSNGGNIERMLEYLSDYSTSAVVSSQFKLYERQKKKL